MRQQEGKGYVGVNGKRRRPSAHYLGQGVTRCSHAQLTDPRGVLDEEQEHNKPQTLYEIKTFDTNVPQPQHHSAAFNPL